MTLYLIAEIGINHNGSLDIVKQLVGSAADAGFDAVKFQKRTVEKVYSKELLDSPRESPWGTTQRDQKMGLEFGREQYREIDLYCRAHGIAWSASAWDMDSQRFIRDFDVPFNKVASAMLGHQPLLREIAAEGKKTFVSTGMATLEEIDQVVDLFRTANCPFELMHCNSTYPMREDDANLRCIPMLKARYGCDVGYSGHESSLIKVCVTAVALGATSLERHITLDRAMYGSDQAASIEIHALRNFVESVRKIPLILGTGRKELIEAELAVRKKLRVEA
ncbi:MAG TPA: N-acetylneuraminate synthase [Cyanobacteria bacterium UBA8530]|nr:N-acetylneuraminate synthase [Cyanobacteria bacterium UBA8530]